jgi:hypothetical protein
MYQRGDPARNRRGGSQREPEEERPQEKSARGKHEASEGDDEWIAREGDWSDHHEDEAPTRPKDERPRRTQDYREPTYKRDEGYQAEKKPYRNTRVYYEEREPSNDKNNFRRGHQESHYR